MVDILVTNDDGYMSSGLEAAVQSAKACGGKVKVYAPYSQQSSVGGKTTFGREIPFELFQADGYSGYAVHGTPMDAMRLAFFGHNLHPDLVISGINFGVQIGGVPIFMSGTCAAAVFAAGQGVPAIAVGYRPRTAEVMYHNHLEKRLSDLIGYPGKALTWIVEKVLDGGMHGADWLNINFPTEPTERVVVVPMEKCGYWNEYVELGDGSFRNFGCQQKQGLNPRADGYHSWRSIVITPVTLDFTARNSLRGLQEMFQ